jgi:hypothetical protein
MARKSDLENARHLIIDAQRLVDVGARRCAVGQRTTTVFSLLSGRLW